MWSGCPRFIRSMRGFNHKEFFLLCVHDSHDMIAMFPQLVKFLPISPFLAPRGYTGHIPESEYRDCGTATIHQANSSRAHLCLIDPSTVPDNVD